MDLHSYLNSIMEEHHIRNLDLAEAADLSPSYISTIRRGKRKPPVGGEVYERIYHGLVDLKNNSSDKWSLPSSYEDFIKIFLPEDIGSDEMPQRLNRLMVLFAVQNKALAKHLNCDPSLISKFRTSNRLQQHESYLLGIADFFAIKVLESPNPEELEKKLKAALDINFPFNLNQESLKNTFLQYLCRNSREVNFFDRMFTMMNGLSPGAMDFSKLLSVLQKASLPGTDVIRRKGYAGLRKLVLNFLSLVVNSDEPLELKLFSNHDMRWMTEDKEFFELWKFLMIAVLNKGHKIQIVHNLSRSDEEMYAAIEGWMPLHLYGNLDSAVFEGTADNGFSHTLFICKDHFCITGHSIKGMEDETDFYFIQSPDLIDSVESSYDSLAFKSKSLIKTAHFYDEVQATEALLDFYKKPFSGRFYSMQKNLPLWTIDEDLLLSMLQRNNIPLDRQKLILDYVSEIRKIFISRIQDEDIYDCFYLPDKFEPGEFALDLINVDVDDAVSYTCEDYVNHLKAIQKLSETYPHYHVLALREAIFPNLKIMKTGEKGIYTVNLLPPLSILRYDNDRLNQNFRGYMEEKLLPLIRNEDEFKTLLMKIYNGDS